MRPNILLGALDSSCLHSLTQPPTTNARWRMACCITRGQQSMECCSGECLWGVAVCMGRGRRRAALLGSLPSSYNCVLKSPRITSESEGKDPASLRPARGPWLAYKVGKVPRPLQCKQVDHSSSSHPLTQKKVKPNQCP